MIREQDRSVGEMKEEKKNRNKMMKRVVSTNLMESGSDDRGEESLVHQFDQLSRNDGMCFSDNGVTKLQGCQEL